MEIHTFFLNLAIILIAARICGEIASRLHAPSVIGELTAGIILGPTLFGWLEPTQIIRLLAEIGIILLLFEVGMETDISRLARTGVKSFIVAITGFAGPFLAGFGISYFVFDLPILTALFIGGTLTATSIGITIRILTDVRRQHSREGQIVLGAAVVDDVLGVILLAVLYEFSISGGVNLVNAGKVMLFIGIFFIVAPLAAKLLSLVIHRFYKITEIPGLIPTTVVSLVLFFAWLSHWVGAPELLGGFAAGLALSRRFFLPFGLALRGSDEFSDRIHSQMTPIVHLFTPIFFVMVGLSLNLRDIDWSSPMIWTFSISLFVLALLAKMASALFIKEQGLTRFAIGLSMVPRGEVGLIFAELGRASGILNKEYYAILVIVIALTTLLPPLVMKAFYARFGHKMEA